jgi:hypothetical protein
MMFSAIDKTLNTVGKSFKRLSVDVGSGKWVLLIF